MKKGKPRTPLPGEECDGCIKEEPVIFVKPEPEDDVAMQDCDGEEEDEIIIPESVLKVERNNDEDNNSNQFDAMNTSGQEGVIVEGQSESLEGSSYLFSVSQRGRVRKTRLPFYQMTEKVESVKPKRRKCSKVHRPKSKGTYKKREESRANAKSKKLEDGESEKESGDSTLKPSQKSRKVSDMTPEELEAYQLHKKRALERYHAKKAELAARRKRVSEMTPEELEAYRAKRERCRNRYKDMSADEREAYRAKARERYRSLKNSSSVEIKSEDGESGMESSDVKPMKRYKRVADMTPEELEAYQVQKKRALERYHAKKAEIAMKKKRVSEMTPEEFEAYKIKRDRQRMKYKKISEVSPEELEKLRAKWKEKYYKKKAKLMEKMTEEEKEAYLKKEEEREARRRAAAEKKNRPKRPYRKRKLGEGDNAVADKVKQEKTLDPEELLRRRRERSQRLVINRIERLARMTDEEIQEQRNRNHVKRQARLAAMTPEEVQQKLERKKNSWGYKKWRERKIEQGQYAEVMMKRRQKTAATFIKRKLLIQELVKQGKSNEEIQQQLESPEARERRLTKLRIIAAKRTLKKRLIAAGASQEEIDSRLEDLAKNYHHVRALRAYKPKKFTLEPVKPEELQVLANVEAKKPIQLPGNSVIDVDAQQNASSAVEQILIVVSPKSEDMQVELPSSISSVPVFATTSSSTDAPQLIRVQQNYSQVPMTFTYSNPVSDINQGATMTLVMDSSFGQSSGVSESSYYSGPYCIDDAASCGDPSSNYASSCNDGDEDENIIVPPPPKRAAPPLPQLKPSPQLSNSMTNNAGPPPHFQNNDFGASQSQPTTSNQIPPKLETSEQHPTNIPAVQSESNNNKSTSSNKSSSGRGKVGRPLGQPTNKTGLERNSTCEICGNAYELKYMRKHMMNVHHPYYKDGYCTLCDGRFKYSEFHKHFKAQHPDASVGDLFKTSGPRVKRISRGKKYVCEICGSSYQSTINLINHKKFQHHPHYQDGACTLCGEKFGSDSRKSKAEFHKHYTQHHANTAESFSRRRKFPQKYMCEECGQKYTQPQALRHHKYYSHGPGALRENYFKCDICPNLSYKRRDMISAHYREHHPGFKPRIVNCPFCSEMFELDAHKDEHVRQTHADKVFPCQYCKVIRNTELGIWSHYSRDCARIPREDKLKFREEKKGITLDIIPAKCHLCGAEVTLPSIERHYREQHGVDEAKHSCLKCGKLFKNRYFLGLHLLEVHQMQPDEWLVEICKPNADLNTVGEVKASYQQKLMENRRKIIERKKAEEEGDSEIESDDVPVVWSRPSKFRKDREEIRQKQKRFQRKLNKYRYPKKTRGAKRKRNYRSSPGNKHDDKDHLSNDDDDQEKSENNEATTTTTKGVRKSNRVVKRKRFLDFFEDDDDKKKGGRQENDHKEEMKILDFNKDKKLKSSLTVTLNKVNLDSIRSSHLVKMKEEIEPHIENIFA